jgi:hypothetical protein
MLEQTVLEIFRATVVRFWVEIKQKRGKPRSAVLDLRWVPRLRCVLTLEMLKINVLATSGSFLGGEMLKQWSPCRDTCPWSLIGFS